MRRRVAAVMLLLLAIVHAPGSVQALVFSLLPDFFALGTHEPIVLLLTGAALSGLAQVGPQPGPLTAAHPPQPVAARGPAPADFVFALPSVELGP